METVEDIVREMRAGPVHACFVTEVGAASDANGKFRDFADRLDEAHKRDMKAVVDANETAMKTAMDEVEKIREENERLKAALKPVLDNVDTEYYTLSNAEDALDACSEAQRIYNRGAK